MKFLLIKIWTVQFYILNGIEGIVVVIKGWLDWLWHEIYILAGYQSPSFAGSSFYFFYYLKSQIEYTTNYTV